jgi:TonB family protein
VSARPRTATALAVSSVAHLALLGALLATVRPAPSPRPLVVRLLRLPGEALASLRAGGREADGVTGQAVHRAPPAAARKPKAPGDSPTPLTAAASAARAEPEVAASGPASEGPAAEGVAAVEARTGAGVGAGAMGVGPASGARLEELHRRLAEAAARCYPLAARRFRLTGEVPLHFCLDAAGAATALSLEGSTGSALLDRSALECVVAGAQPLSGFEGCFLVPVRFGG